MMCDVCGCAHGEVRIEGEAGKHTRPREHHVHSHNHEHQDGHEHPPVHEADGRLHFGTGPARAHAPGLSQARMVQIEQDVLARNDAYAGGNRARLEELGVVALNLVSSPGSGKTSLLTATIERLRQAMPLAVIEGDQQTVNDAERIRATGVQALQINTGKGCHLDAHMVGHALDGLSLEEGAVLFIENVGNLVCPASFDLGEAHKVVILSVTEGEDKPIKYPDMFAAADLLLLNKIDLLPHLDFDVAACIGYATRVNPDIPIIQLSARTGEGLEAWLAWIGAARTGSLQRRVRAIESHLHSLRRTLEDASGVPVTRGG